MSVCNENLIKSFKIMVSSKKFNILSMALYTIYIAVDSVSTILVPYSRYIRVRFNDILSNKIVPIIYCLLFV